MEGGRERGRQGGREGGVSLHSTYSSIFQGRIIPVGYCCSFPHRSLSYKNPRGDRKSWLETLGPPH